MRTQTTVNPDKEMKVPHCMKRLGLNLYRVIRTFVTLYMKEIMIVYDFEFLIAENWRQENP